jgi:hypothetical protein
MVDSLAALDPHKAVLPIVALIGLVPIVLQYRSRSKWFVVGYLLLVVATVATNVENLLLGDLLNYTEHVVGLLGSGVAFLVAGYIRRQQLFEEDRTHDSGDREPDPQGGEHAG